MNRISNPIEPAIHRRHRAITVIAVLMILFGAAEVVAAFSHNFFGIRTAQATIATFAGVAIGVFYFVAGSLILTMKKRAVGFALVLLVAIIIGRIAMSVTGLYPTDSLKQIFAIVAGTSIVAAFALYLRLKWSAFA
jgi:hypothetical protein